VGPTPDIAGKELLVSGTLERSVSRNPASPTATAAPVPYSGVVVAQGTSDEGYGLYLQDNKLWFQVNQAGKAYKVSTTEPLPPTFAFKAGLKKDGTMALFVNDKQAATTKSPGLFKKELTAPVRVGLDNLKGDQRLAEFPDSLFFLRGNLNNAKLETLAGTRPAAAPVTGAIAKTIVVKVVKDVMKFDKQLITAQAGTTIQVVIQNPDFMQHNFVLIKPKTLEKVGAAADKLAQDPNGAKMQYVPKMPEVISATPLLNPSGKFTLTIKVPNEPGDYPYVCTFPGHWRIMNGILRVTK
jgi:uncharacterized protein